MEKPTKEQLEQFYWHDNLTFREIGERCSTSATTVYRWAVQYNMEVRTPKKKPSRPTKEWLLQRHNVEGVTWEQIMQETGYSTAGLHNLLHRYGIERKPHTTVEKTTTPEELYQWYVVEGMTAVKIGARIGRHHSAVSRALHRLGLTEARSHIQPLRVPPISKEELQQLYFWQRLSCSAIGKRYGVSFSTVKRWLQDYELLPKARPERARRTYTRTATEWNRFSNEFNAEERHRVLQRDGWHCQMPGCGCEDKKILEVHHIIPASDDGGHELSNGITLCRPCHIGIKNRENDYVALFSQIITMRLTYMQTHCIGENLEAGNAEGTVQLEIEWTP